MFSFRPYDFSPCSIDENIDLKLRPQNNCFFYSYDLNWIFNWVLIFHFHSLVFHSNLTSGWNHIANFNFNSWNQEFCTHFVAMDGWNQKIWKFPMGIRLKQNGISTESWWVERAFVLGYDNAYMHICINSYMNGKKTLLSWGKSCWSSQNILIFIDFSDLVSIWKISTKLNSQNEMIN